MSDKSENAAESLVNNIIEHVSDAVSKQKTVRFSTDNDSVSDQVNNLLGGKKSVHHVLGGGKCKRFSVHNYIVGKYICRCAFSNWKMIVN